MLGSAPIASTSIAGSLAGVVFLPFNLSDRTLDLDEEPRVVYAVAEVREAIVPAEDRTLSVETVRSRSITV